jgi:phospholipid/cholesterol/gamma-HCH transport system substrate-binding protein
MPHHTVSARAATALRLRLYGVVFLAILTLLLGLAVAQYRKAFTPFVPVTLETGHVGLQLAPPADVKLRGVIVGEARRVRVSGDHAEIDLALDPAQVAQIPAGVSARLLPKTLFGEKYVELVAPSQGSRAAAEYSGRHIRAGDVIPQDRSQVAIEIERVLNDLMPLLRTLQPDKLNATLDALATALEGRGDQLGDNLARLDHYVKQLNPHLPTLEADVSQLADVADLYDQAAPDLLRILRNLTTTSDTLVAKQDQLDSFVTEVTGVSGIARQVLAENEQRLIQVGKAQRPTLALLARYSPEFPCLLGGLTGAESRLDDAFHDGALNITLEVVRPRAPYRPGEEPRYLAHQGPACYGLPDHPPVPAPAQPLPDGSDPDAVNPPALPPTPVSLGHVSATAEEQGVVDALLAPVMQVPADQVPPVATLLFGPMARGTVVNLA